jgi:hypothetical protein
MTRAEEIKSLQKVIKTQNDLILTQKQEIEDQGQTIKQHKDTAITMRTLNEDLRATERSNDSLRAIIASANKGFGLHITKTA